MPVRDGKEGGEGLGEKEERVWCGKSGRWRCVSESNHIKQHSYGQMLCVWRSEATSCAGAALVGGRAR